MYVGLPEQLDFREQFAPDFSAKSKFVSQR